MREVDFDIITSKLADYAPEAEVVKVVDEVLDEFPPFHGGGCFFLVNHADVADIIFDYCRIPNEARRDVAAVLGLPGRASPLAQARAQLTEQYRLSPSSLNELALFHIQGEFQTVAAKLSTMLSDETLRKKLSEAVAQVKLIIDQCRRAGVQRRVAFAPLITLNYHYYTHGFIFHAVVNRKAGGIIAAGGRYDALIRKFRHPTITATKRSHGVGVNFAVQKVVAAMLQYQTDFFNSVLARRPEHERLFGQWAPKRCDVYVASFGRGLMGERFAIARELWTHRISADLQYDENAGSGGIDRLVQQCRQQGISWIVLARHRSSDNRGTAATVKVKSALKKVELEVLRSELCSYLQAELAEQSHVEHLLAGGKLRRSEASGPHTSASAIDSAASSDAEHERLVVPSQLNVSVVQVTRDAAICRPSSMRLTPATVAANDVARVANDIVRGDVPTLVLDLNESVLKRLGQCNVRDADSFRKMVEASPPAQRKYLQDVRTAMLQAHDDKGRDFLWLYSFRDEYCVLYRFD
ncbi:anticodon binding domain of tRNAs-domain-containing protein [Thamnocephalis sphaerospora]|uniref:non-specific serine/threonine protein kinase n=1 Tax=Thamnocephalis sphaerospora TaxID=78915 RepID=A0A4P9XXM1_9FUNG|nr:anticodon binding domain of tRNAs-domain-containing protein [Thamnocephalis sphaerospora]|eukprot:RKP11077.1 anticodon binding domain of tRNAs-domain-containing protein [Thamnocephalis sphaerospora]